MNVTITPAALGGAVTPPPSKSQAHRLIIAAALSDGVCRLSNVELSQDIQATLRCMRTLDADASADGTVIRGADLVDGFETPPPEIMDCGESGSTLRFLIPVALALKGGGRFTGHGRLMERPQEPYFRLFAEKGIAWTLENGVLAVEGRLTPGVYALPGDVSSQFITGLLYALPLLEGDSELVLTTALESRGYVDMTLDALAQFGVSAEYDGDRRFRVPGNQAYRHRDLAIEGDWSNAAFWFAAAFLGHGVDVEGLRPRRPGLARYVCSEAESAWLERQGGDWGAFYTLWTLKEARVKCTGEGLRRPPRDIAVPLLRPGETGELDGLVFSAFSGETWRAAACCPTPQGPLELFVRNS